MTLSPLTHPALGVPHGFFTREGGVSEGLYASLNGGQGSGDAHERVAQNRARIAATFGLRADCLVSVHQVHSAGAVRVTGPWPGARPRADGMVAARPGVALAILTADCAPVLLADPAAGVIGACHAGWRGAAAGIIAATVAAMTAAGARRGAIRAALGPCISQRNYEVGPEFVDAFIDEDAENGRFFAGGAGDRALFDLAGFCLARLRAEGVAAEWAGHCTYADPHRFFSYRRATHAGEADYGRLVSAIALPARA